ncbi:MAG TPA: NADH-quinone oxidoreductase subunit J [Hyphomicrobiales bacterium]|nr:NADH-quinone oxidoreductase subunit J [Hyphomicrobiales bacterium]
MILATIFFYILSVVAVAAGLMVIAARNPVHSVLFLVLAFIASAGLFILMGAEFLAWILVVVYVGAVAVLFLFVVMMLDVDFAALKQNLLQYLPIGALIGVIVLAELVMVVGGWTISPEAHAHLATPAPALAQVSNIQALGRVIYTDYLFWFQLAGLILLVAMVGAIVLTLQHRVRVKRQSIAEQVARPVMVELRKVSPGQGV